MQSTISSTYVEFTAVCAGCSHCRDLQGSNPASDPPELAAARAFALQTIVAWVAAPGGAAAAGASAGFTAGQAAAVGAILAGVVGVAVASSVRAGGGGGAGPTAEKRPLLAAR